MQVLVVDCLTAGEGKRRFTRDFIGAGPRTIAGFIQKVTQQAISVQIIRGEDLLLPKNNHICQKSTVLCVSAMTMDLGIVKQIFRKWIEWAPPSHLSIIGGPITADQNLLGQIPVDMAVLGEGETALFQIFQNPNKIPKISDEWTKSRLNQIPNIRYRLEDEIFLSECTQKSVNFWFETTTGFPEMIPFYPEFTQARIYVECVRGCSNYRRTALPLKIEGKQAICESSLLSKDSKAGCQVCNDSFTTPLYECPANIPPGCGFCSTIGEFGATRSRNIDAIISEIKYLIQEGVRRIVLGAPDLLDFHREKLVQGPLIDPRFPEPNYEALNSLISQLVQIPLIQSYEVQLFIENIKPSLCTDQALDLLARIPNPIFSIGCETGSKTFARLLGRPSAPEETLDAIRRAIARKIRIHVYFIHSLPGDNAEYAHETLIMMEKMVGLGVDKITLYKYQELPGSPFFQIDQSMKQFSKIDLRSFEKIKRFVIHYNGKQKEKMVGSVISVFISEVNTQQPADAIGWILEGGPKVSVQKGAKFLGKVKKVQITRVISDRLIEGFLKN